MINYNKYIKMLKEGLILSHDITKYKSIITTKLDQFGVKYDIEVIDKLEFDLTLYNPNKDIIDIINHYSFTIGYYPSYCWITLDSGMKNSFKWSKFKYNSKISILKIKYESKYEDGQYKNSIICPDILYHLTHQDNKMSILKKGIYPKSKNRISDHPRRICLFEEIENYLSILKFLKYSDNIDNIYKDYMLIEINCSKDKLILHTDPTYRLGWFTYDNINPLNIKSIKENL